MSEHSLEGMRQLMALSPETSGDAWLRFAVCLARLPFQLQRLIWQLLPEPESRGAARGYTDACDLVEACCAHGHLPLDLLLAAVDWVGYSLIDAEMTCKALATVTGASLSHLEAAIARQKRLHLFPPTVEADDLAMFIAAEIEVPADMWEHLEGVATILAHGADVHFADLCRAALGAVDAHGAPEALARAAAAAEAIARKGESVINPGAIAACFPFCLDLPVHPTMSLLESLGRLPFDAQTVSLLDGLSPAWRYEVAQSLSIDELHWVRALGDLPVERWTLAVSRRRDLGGAMPAGEPFALGEVPALAPCLDLSDTAWQRGLSQARLLWDDVPRPRDVGVLQLVPLFAIAPERAPTPAQVRALLREDPSIVPALTALARRPTLRLSALVDHVQTLRTGKPAPLSTAAALAFAAQVLDSQQT